MRLFVLSFLFSLSLCHASDIVEVSSFGFVLRAAPRDLVLKDGALEALRSCRLKTQELFGFDIKGDIPVEVYRTKKDFAAGTTLGEELLKKSGVVGTAKFNRLMVITPEALPFGYSWPDAICHEFLHHALKTEIGEDLPLWFHEGFARFNETIWRGVPLEIPPGDREELLLAAKENKLVKFSQM